MSYSLYEKVPHPRVGVKTSAWVIRRLNAFFEELRTGPEVSDSCSFLFFFFFLTQCEILPLSKTINYIKKKKKQSLM